MHLRDDFAPKLCWFLALQGMKRDSCIAVRGRFWSSNQVLDYFISLNNFQDTCEDPRACLTLKFSFLCSSVVVTTGKEACPAAVQARARGSAPEECFNGLKWNGMNKDLRVAFTVQIGEKK